LEFRCLSPVRLQPWRVSVVAAGLLLPTWALPAGVSAIPAHETKNRPARAAASSHGLQEWLGLGILHTVNLLPAHGGGPGLGVLAAAPVNGPGGWVVGWLQHRSGLLSWQAHVASAQHLRPGSDLRAHVLYRAFGVDWGLWPPHRQDVSLPTFLKGTSPVDSAAPLPLARLWPSRFPGPVFEPLGPARFRPGLWRPAI